MRGKDDSKGWGPGRTTMYPVWGLEKVLEETTWPLLCKVAVHREPGSNPRTAIKQRMAWTRDIPPEPQFLHLLPKDDYSTSLIMLQRKIKEILLEQSLKHSEWSINVSFICIVFNGPGVKEERFLRSCLKPISNKSFPSWILEQFLIWDDKNNLSWQMAQCCHPLCCLELNELCISTPTLLPCLEVHLTVRSAGCSGCSSGPGRWREGPAMQAGRQADGPHRLNQRGQQVMLPNIQAPGLSSLEQHLLLIYATSPLWLSAGFCFMLFSSKDPS